MLRVERAQRSPAISGVGESDRSMVRCNLDQRLIRTADHHHVSSRSGSERVAEVDEHSELALDELRALLRRIELRQLEASDWRKADALLAKFIDEAEATGQEQVIIELVRRDPQL